MFRSPCCQEIGIPKSAAFTLPGNVDCAHCNAKLKRKRLTIKQVLHVMWPLAVVIVYWFAAHRILQTPRKVPGWEFPVFFWWLVCVSMILLVYLNTVFARTAGADDAGAI